MKRKRFTEEQIIGILKANELNFGHPGAWREMPAFPQLRLVSLVENKTHVILGIEWGRYQDSENALARRVLTRLEAGAPCRADRGFIRCELEKEGPISARSTSSLLNIESDNVAPLRA